MHVRLILALTCFHLAAGPGLAGAELVSVFHWERKEPYFGGMSGIDVTPDGRTYVAIGDNAQVLTGQIERVDGQIVGATSRWIGGLRTSTGQRVSGDLTDSEGIAMLPDGSFYVSFERKARVWKYADWEASAFPLPLAPGFRSLANNSALEAVAVDADGHVYTIPERATETAQGHPVYRFDGAGWRVVSRIPASPSWRIVGADFAPDGRLYVLERRYVPVLGFGSRVRRFQVLDGSFGEVVLRTGFGVHDNLEGLAVWTDPAGATRLLMVSDDNYRDLQRTELVEYRLTD